MSPLFSNPLQFLFYTFSWGKTWITLSVKSFFVVQHRNGYASKKRETTIRSVLDTLWLLTNIFCWVNNVDHYLQIKKLSTDKQSTERLSCISVSLCQTLWNQRCCCRWCSCRHWSTTSTTPLTSNVLSTLLPPYSSSSSSTSSYTKSSRVQSQSLAAAENPRLWVNQLFKYEDFQPDKEKAPHTKHNLPHPPQIHQICKCWPFLGLKGPFIIFPPYVQQD